MLLKEIVQALKNLSYAELEVLFSLACKRQQEITNDIRQKLEI